MTKFHKQSVVCEKTGKSLLSLDVDNKDNRLKYEREMVIGEPTLKTLKRLRREQQKRVIMDMCSFHRNVTRYLTMHLPFANELAVLYPLMLKEDQVCQLIRRTVKKLSHIIRQDYVGQLTYEWKIYHGQESTEDWYITGHQ